MKRCPACIWMNIGQTANLFWYSDYVIVILFALTIYFECLFAARIFVDGDQNKGGNKDELQQMNT